MNMTWLNKNTVFSLILLAVIASILHRIIPRYVTPTFTLVISKNRVSIADIHQPRDIEAHKEVKVDLLDLAEGNRFRHAVLGDLGYAGDYFVDIKKEFTVNKAGNYTFYVSSDDGFNLKVDGRQLCEWTHDRPLTQDTCQVQLGQGKHEFTLVYFQGYGNAGLIMSYAFTSDGRQYIAGSDSSFITF